MATRQRVSQRADTQSVAMQEEVLAISTKLSETNARLIIAENGRVKLDQELASEK